nr:spore germination protein [Cohnella faecalis]
MLSTEQSPEARLFQTTVLHKRTVLLKQSFGKSDDLIVKGLPLGTDLRSAICYIDGMIDTKHIQSAVMEPLNMLLLRNDLKNLNSTADTIAYLTERVLTAGDIGIVRTSAALMEQLLSGSVILFLDGISDAIRIASPGWENRSVTEPTSQSVVRGPMEAFTENIRTNTTLLRRRIRNSRLWLETRQIGRLTQTSVTLAYINGVASEEAVAEIRKRLDLIDIDGILEGGYVEEFIQSRTYSPFPTVYNSERPDTIAAGLLEGRIAILVDGPFCHARSRAARSLFSIS